MAVAVTGALVREIWVIVVGAFVGGAMVSTVAGCAVAGCTLIRCPLVWLALAITFKILALYINRVKY